VIRADAERPGLHSHAERGNEDFRGSATNFPRGFRCGFLESVPIVESEIVGRGSVLSFRSHRGTVGAIIELNP